MINFMPFVWLGLCVAVVFGWMFVIEKIMFGVGYVLDKIGGQNEK